MSKHKASIVQILLRLKEEIERQELERSADLYAEVYEEEAELKELTETAISEWPE